MNNESPAKKPASSEAPATAEKRSTDLNFFYPEHNITVVAKDREEADNKLEEALAKREGDK